MLYISHLETSAHAVYYVNHKMVHLVHVTDSETGNTIKYKRVLGDMYGRIDEGCTTLYKESVFSNVYGYVADKGFWKININDLYFYELLDFDKYIKLEGSERNDFSIVLDVVDDSYTLFRSSVHISNDLFTLGGLLRGNKDNLYYEINEDKLTVRMCDITGNAFAKLQYTILDTVKFNRLITKAKVLSR